ncbi:hypothetical protein ACFE04_001306 [Oxalis oulophora]
MADRSRKLLPRQCKRLRPGQTSVDCVVPVVVVENYTRPLTRLAAKTVVAEEHFSNTTSCKKNKKMPRISNSQSSQLVVLSESNANKPTKRLTRHSYKNNNESKIQPIAQSLTQTENPNKATEDSNSEETLCSEAALPFAENKDDFATNQNFQEKDHICATKNDKKMQQESDTSSNRCTDVSEFGTQLEIPSEIDSEKLHDRAEGGTHASAGNALKLAICYEGRAIENVVNATKSNERSSTSKVIESGNSSESAERDDALKTEERKAEGNESKDNNESQIQLIEQSLTQTESSNEATKVSNSEETLSSEDALPFAENKDNSATNQNFIESDTSSNRFTNVSEFGTQLQIPSEIDSEKLHDRAEGGTQASAGNALKLAISYEGAVENATECNERSSTSKLVESGKSSESAERHDALKTEERKTEGNESKEDMMEFKTDLCSLAHEEEGPSRVSFSGSDGHVVSSPSREYLRDELNALNDAENEARNIDSLNASTSELVVNVSVDDNPTDMDSLFEEENKNLETGMIVI